MAIPTNGREANEQGYLQQHCPFPVGPERDQWLRDWADAQLDRDLWLDLCDAEAS